MSDKKISQFNELTTAAAADLIPIVDVATSETKFIQKGNLIPDSSFIKDIVFKYDVDTVLEIGKINWVAPTADHTMSVPIADSSYLGEILIVNNRSIYSLTITGAVVSPWVVTGVNSIVGLVCVTNGYSYGWETFSYFNKGDFDLVSQTITNGVTTKAPSEDAVFDALALKAPIASPTFTGTLTTPDVIVSGATASTPTFFDSAKKLITTTAQLWGTWVQTWANKATPVDADTIGFHDSATTFVGVKSTLLNLWTAYIKVKADLLYLKSAGLTANYLPYYNGTNLVNSTLQRGADFIATTTQVIAGKTISGGNTSYNGRYNQNSHPDLYGVDTIQAAILNTTAKGLHLYNAGLFMPYIQSSGWLSRTTGIQKYHDGQDFGGGNNPSWNYSGPYPEGVYHVYASLSNTTDTSEAYITVNGIGNVTNIDVTKPSSNITFSIVTNKVNIASATNIVAIFKYIGSSKTNSQLINLKYSSTGLASYWTGSEGLGVGPSSQNASAIFQADSTTKDLLPPRMTSAQKELIADVEGLIVYDTDLNSLCQNDGVRWTTFAQGGTSLVFVFVKSDFPAPSGGIITLLANTTYFINGTIDLTGDRIVCGANTTIIGGSSENCRIKSTGLVSALITSVYSFPLRNITIEASLALNLDGDGTTTALDWFGVNFTDCAVIGTVKDYTNFIMSDCAFLNSGGMTIDGTLGSAAFAQSLFDCNAGNTAFILPATLTITRRFKIKDSSFVVLSGETGINVDAGATIPTEAYILGDVNFSGGGTYLTGVTHTSNDALFSNCVGITNTAVNGQLYMQANATATTVSATNTFYKVLGTTTASADNSKFTHANNRLTCDAVISRKYLLHCDLSFSSTATNVCEFGFYDSQLSAVRTPSKTKSTANSAGRAENISFGCVVTMVAGDYIEIHCANTSAVNDITVDQLNFIITEIR